MFMNINFNAMNIETMVWETEGGDDIRGGKGVLRLWRDGVQLFWGEQLPEKWEGCTGHVQPVEGEDIVWGNGEKNRDNV